MSMVGRLCTVFILGALCGWVATKFCRQLKTILMKKCVPYPCAIQSNAAASTHGRCSDIVLFGVIRF